jgi:threonyl-tRNA synthetase
MDRNFKAELERRQQLEAGRKIVAEHEKKVAKLKRCVQLWKDEYDDMDFPDYVKSISDTAHKLRDATYELRKAEHELKEAKDECRYLENYKYIENLAEEIVRGGGYVHGA